MGRERATTAIDSCRHRHSGSGQSLSRCRNLLSPCPADTGEEHLLTDLQMANTRADLRDFTHAPAPGSEAGPRAVLAGNLEQKQG